MKCVLYILNISRFINLLFKIMYWLTILVTEDSMVNKVDTVPALKKFIV